MLALIAAKAGGAKGVKLADYLPDYDRPPDDGRPQTPEEMDRQMRKIAALWGASQE